MSGRTKTILYRIADGGLYLAAIAGTVIAVIFTVPVQTPGLGEYLAVGAMLLLIIFGLPVFCHELGHLVFGLLAGMKLAAFRVSLFGGSTAGSTAMYPKNGKHIRGKFLCFTLGGSACNLLVGALLIVPYCVLAYHPVWLCCFMLAPFFLHEGIRALLPACLPAGKTDGAVLAGLLKHAPEEEVALRVLTVQGILYRGGFDAVPRALLFGAPVVREDLPALHALLFLKAQYLIFSGKDGEADAIFNRLLSLEELGEEQREAVQRYLNRREGFTPAKTPFAGIAKLEEGMKR